MAISMAQVDQEVMEMQLKFQRLGCSKHDSWEMSLEKRFKGV